MARNKGRDISGILLLDKPAGLTSNAALQAVKRLYRARKAGHTGSLDPLATGLLPLCFGEATKVSSFLLGADKRYAVTCRLGVVTETGDAEGRVREEHDVPVFTDSDLESVLVRFRGEIQQIPPMYSAVKHKGERLYRLARQGVEVERAPRQVWIHELRVLARSATEVQLEVACSKGSYVRTLVEDIGAALGPGAHVSALRRTGLGPFEAPRMHTLDTLESAVEQGVDALDALLLPLEAALTQWPDLHLSADVAFYLRQGQPVFVPRAPEAGGWVRLYGQGGRFLGMGTVLDDGRVAPKRLLATARG